MATRIQSYPSFQITAWVRKDFEQTQYLRILRHVVRIRIGRPLLPSLPPDVLTSLHAYLLTSLFAGTRGRRGRQTKEGGRRVGVRKKRAFLLCMWYHYVHSSSMQRDKTEPAPNFLSFPHLLSSPFLFLRPFLHFSRCSLRYAGREEKGNTHFPPPAGYYKDGGGRCHH